MINIVIQTCSKLAKKLRIVKNNIYTKAMCLPLKLIVGQFIAKNTN